jgi:hypothetical protein
MISSIDEQKANVDFSMIRKFLDVMFTLINEERSKALSPIEIRDSSNEIFGGSPEHPENADFSIMEMELFNGANSRREHSAKADSPMTLRLEV